MLSLLHNLVCSFLKISSINSFWINLFFNHFLFLFLLSFFLFFLSLLLNIVISICFFNLWLFWFSHCSFSFFFSQSSFLFSSLHFIILFFGLFSLFLLLFLRFFLFISLLFCCFGFSFLNKFDVVFSIPFADSLESYIVFSWCKIGFTFKNQVIEELLDILLSIHFFHEGHLLIGFTVNHDRILFRVKMCH
jgi:hypothetical protein